MPLFAKKPKLVTCPICKQELTEEDMSHGHLFQHVEQITELTPMWLPSELRVLALGTFTWKCACGIADMHWPHEGGAASGLQIHLAQGHGLDLGLPGIGLGHRIPIRRLS